jgi:hypothetical protein
MLRMAVPHISIEGDFEERDWEDFAGLGVRAVHLAAEAHGDAIDEKSVKENIADADEENGAEAAPGEDPCNSCRLGRLWCGGLCRVNFRRVAGFGTLLFGRFL